MISPYSVSSALSMCFAGAQSDTAKELGSLLGYSDMSKQEALELCQQYAEYLKDLGYGTFLSIANKIFSNLSSVKLNDEFNQKLIKHFKCEACPIDFSKSEESAETINDWVAKKTDNKIKDIVDSASIKEWTKMIVVNAIYFKAEWQTKFSKRATREDDFKLKDGTVKKVSMMQITEKYFSMNANPGGLKVKTLQLPYSYKTAMTIILPDEGINIDEIENSMDQKVLKEILKDENQSYLNVFMPKFKIEFSGELSEYLKALGAKLPFESEADFSGMSDDKGLSISQVMHKTIIEVDEDGTVAAAATALRMLGSCFIEDEPVDFKINRPFLFIIHDKIQNGILFIGKCSSP